MWKKLEKEYKPHMDYAGLDFFERGCFWQKQHHIYSFPLYYIDYVIAQLCAFEYKIWMDKDRRGSVGELSEIMQDFRFRVSY